MHRKFVAVVFIAIFCWGSADSQDKATPMRLERLASTNTEIRRQVSEDLYGSGISDVQTFDAIAKLLESELSEVKRGDDRVDEISQHLATLGASGNMRYMPVIETAINNQLKNIASDARHAKELLQRFSAEGRPFLASEKIRLVTEKQAEDCAYIGQKSCEDRGGTIESCTDEIRQQTLEAGGDSILLINQSAGGGWFGLASVTGNLYRCNASSSK